MRSLNFELGLYPNVTWVFGAYILVRVIYHPWHSQHYPSVSSDSTESAALCKQAPIHSGSSLFLLYAWISLWQYPILGSANPNLHTLIFFHNFFYTLFFFTPPLSFDFLFLTSLARLLSRQQIRQGKIGIHFCLFMIFWKERLGLRHYDTSTYWFMLAIEGLCYSWCRWNVDNLIGVIRQYCGIKFFPTVSILLIFNLNFFFFCTHLLRHSYQLRLPIIFYVLPVFIRLCLLLGIAYCCVAPTCVVRQFLFKSQKHFKFISFNTNVYFRGPV